MPRGRNAQRQRFQAEFKRGRHRCDGLGGIGLRAAIVWMMGIVGRLDDGSGAIVPAQTGGFRQHAQINQSGFAEQMLVGLA
jgi:hypothetical protein